MKALTAAILLAPIVALPQFATAQDAGAVLLKSKLEVGKTYNFRQGTDMKMALPLAGAGDSTTKMSMDMQMSVEKAPDGVNKLVTTKFGRVKMEMQMAGQNMVYDSEDETKQNPLLKTAFEQMKDVEFKAIYDKDDKFLKVEGDGGAGAGALAGGMGMGAAEMEQMLKQLTDYGFPAHPVKPGEKWDHKQEAKMGQMGAMSMDMQFTYVGPAERDGKKVAEIDVTGTIGGAADEGAAGLVEFKDSTLKGKMFFDHERGVLLNSTIDMDMTMAVGGDAGAEMDTKTKSTFDLLSVE